MLSVIRQAAEFFSLQQAAGEMLTLLGAFSKEWGRYVDAIDRVEGDFQKLSKDFDSLTGTRRRAMERQLHKLDNLRTQQADGIAELADGEQSKPETA